MLAYEGDSRFEWFEGNFQDYEKHRIPRLGADSVNNHKVTYKRLTRQDLWEPAATARWQLVLSNAAAVS